MRGTWETKHVELMKKLREKRRKKMKKIKHQEKSIPTTNKPSVNNSCRAVSVDHYFMVQKIRESRDYSFLFSDDSFEPNPKTSNATSRKTSNKVVGVGPELEEIKKPQSSLKIKLKCNMISPEALRDSREPYLENLECKKSNLELLRDWSDDESD